jgi:ribonuclease III family protein
MVDYLTVAMTDDEVNMISAQGLAHLGDAAFELMVRTWLCRSGRATAKGLHRAAITYVSAQAQARGIEKILPVLTEEELAVFRRGRNTHVNTVPRSATLDEYHASTGFESLFGYLWLKGRTDRLNQLFEIIITE